MSQRMFFVFFVRRAFTLSVLRGIYKKRSNHVTLATVSVTSSVC
jgi:hypothetical protein